MTFPRSKAALVLAAITLAAGALALLREPGGEHGGEPGQALAASGDLPQLGLMTTLPIYWNEAESVDELVQTQTAGHWARSVLETRFRLVPLDTLAAGGGLADLDLLILAQPRALSPQENVALDDWVSGGGRLMLFADPMLSGESRFHFGDRRRPQDVALLSPILARWGLELMFDETQGHGERMVTASDLAFPVQLAGQWRVLSPQASCQKFADDVVARCRIDDGAVLAIADAAMLEQGQHGDAYPEALYRMAELAFDSPHNAGAGNHGN